MLIPVGLYVLPRLFERVALLRNREVFILAVGAVALGAAYVASLFGISIALGAFVAGVLVGESDLSHQILGEIEPLRDILAGLFFVSVGMLVDPLFIVQNLPLVAATVALIVVLKGAVIAGLIRLFGYCRPHLSPDGRGAGPGRRAVVPARVDWRRPTRRRHDGVQRDAGRLGAQHDPGARRCWQLRRHWRAVSIDRARSIRARSRPSRQSGGDGSPSSAGTAGWAR